VAAPASPHRIPPMHLVLEAPEAAALAREHDRESLRRACARALDAERARLRAGYAFAGLDGAFWSHVRDVLAVLPGLKTRRALNATGVVLHTNLGRAPWPAEAAAAVANASGVAMVEVDRATGKRGRRESAVSDLLVQVTGAEAGLAVNNNAAALLLAVSALARGRKAVVARRELVEIGGSYRMPEVVAAAGAEMVAVGTTNRVHLADYERVLADPEVACVLKVHPSNFSIEGFTGEPPLEELSALCRARGLPLAYDLGSGVLVGAEWPALEGEPTVADALARGCDLVTFSGDKLLGGPQAGLIVGAKPLVERLRRDMLTRCLRLDKAMLAALEAVLSIHALGPDAAVRRIPALARLALTAEQLRPRAEALAAALDGRAYGWSARAVACESRVGSGASPTAGVPSWGVQLRAPDASGEEMAARLRALEPPVFARVQDDGLLLDLRTLGESELDELRALLLA
jgi:L-seryl-tRNA(Ser) seleniumtransferase